MKILLFAGAGTSVELGVPSMAGLAREFVAHATQWNVDPALVEQLMGDKGDLEYLVERVDRICDVKGEVDVGIDADLIGRAERIRGEVEWFVQHVAERISAEDARLMWGPVLKTTMSVDVAFATTNYDRAIELAANAERIGIDDGFEATNAAEVMRWSGFAENGETVALIKLHGSTDWYTDQQSYDPTKLAHPMPLFGDGFLTLGEQELGSALVLPSREKILTRDPYPRLSQKFLNTADMCDLALFVGSSLRDNQIHGAARSLAERVPVVIVNPDGDGRGIPSAFVIPQSASRFLVSTLPDAIASENPAAILESVHERATETPAPCDGILGQIRAALDQEMTSTERCQAIDDLVRVGATLPAEWVRQLLAGDEADVARYALGLVLRSSRREELMAVAQTSRHKSNASFADELDLLCKLVDA